MMVCLDHQLNFISFTHAVYYEPYVCFLCSSLFAPTRSPQVLFWFAVDALMPTSRCVFPALTRGPPPAPGAAEDERNRRSDATARYSHRLPTTSTDAPPTCTDAAVLSSGLGLRLLLRAITTTAIIELQHTENVVVAHTAAPVATSLVPEVDA